jgi:peptide/nickel transport system ATP-binding protein
MIKKNLEKKSVLKIEDLNLSLIQGQKEIPILLNISFEIFEGEVFSIAGESGCGKSLTSLAITKILPIQSFVYKTGKIVLNDIDLLKSSNSEISKIRGKEISYIFQDPFSSLNPLKKIKHQIIESYLIHISNNEKEALEKAEFLLNKIGITDIKTRLESYPNQMSGGILQRILIASALMCNPKLLIADEPTSALDVTIQAQLVELLISIQKETNMAILFISHDLPLISSFSNRIAIMYAGQIIEIGDSKKIITSPNHPYTKALIDSIPNGLNIMQKKLSIIDGIVPAPIDYPLGCHFYERCIHRFEKCLSNKPNLFKVNANQSSACFLKEK